MAKTDFNRQFPPPSGLYKVCLNKKAPWQSHDRARLQISIGNPKYEGDKFKALCEWISHRFAHVDVIVSDTLQRYNIKELYGEERARQISKDEGDRWLSRNKEALAMLTSKTVMRWDDLLQQAQYCEHKKEMDGLYEENADFRMNVIKAAKNDPEFILEEIAVFKELFKTPAMDIYAGSWFVGIMDQVFQEKEYLSVDMERNKAFQPAFSPAALACG